jgi:hypothetical protein
MEDRPRVIPREVSIDRVDLRLLEQRGDGRPSTGDQTRRRIGEEQPRLEALHANARPPPARTPTLSPIRLRNLARQRRTHP